MPLLAIPLAETLSKYRRRPVLQVGFGALLLTSLHNAVAYNLHHVKHVGELVDESFSGWKVNLLFPRATRDWMTFELADRNDVLYVTWLIVMIVLLFAPVLCPFARRWAGWTARVQRSLPGWARVSGAVAGLLLLITLTPAAIGVTAYRTYRTPADVAALETMTRLDDLGHCRICVLSSDGAVGTTAVKAYLARFDRRLTERVPTR